MGVTYDKGRHWMWLSNLPVGQFYHVGYDMAQPFNICGGLQDNDAWCGPSATRSQLRCAVQGPSLASFAAWIVDGAELDVGGWYCSHLRLRSSGSGLHGAHAAARRTGCRHGIVRA